MQTLNQLKIGNTVYDLAAKFDAEDNNIKDTYSTKEYVTQKISELVNSAPETLDTLNELAAALNNDSNFATTIITQLRTKVDNSAYSEDKKTFALKTEIPTTLPASDVSAWAKKSTKPTYTATEIGLDQVNNTADMDKPVSTATQTALDGKVDKVKGKQLSTNDYSAEEKSTVAQLKADVEQLKSTVETLTQSLQELKAGA